jgi:hypothetical protein
MANHAPLQRFGLHDEEMIDLLLALHDECSNPVLKKEKQINDFVNQCL